MRHKNDLKRDLDLPRYSCQKKLIRQRFNFRLSEASVGCLGRTLALTSQKPLHQVYQQKHDPVKQWKEETNLHIRQKAKKVGAVIYSGDEASIRG